MVENYLPDYSFPDFLNHQLRWARSTRDSRSMGYLGVALTFGLPWAMLAVVLSRGHTWAWLLLAAAVVVRFAMALVLGKRIMQDPQVPADLWLLPLRDVLALLIWAASYAGHTVAWRGDHFILEKGKLKPVEG